MDSTKVASWLQIIGNLGLLIGLVLVAVQINQATYLVQNQLFSDQITDRQNYYFAMLGENPADAFAKAVMEPENLTDPELVVMTAWMDREINYWLRVRRLTDAGVYPPEIWRQHSDAIDYALAWKFGRTWWAVEREEYLKSHAGFVADIDVVVQSLSGDTDWDKSFAKLRRALSEAD